MKKIDWNTCIKLDKELVDTGLEELERKLEKQLLWQERYSTDKPLVEVITTSNPEVKVTSVGPKHKQSKTYGPQRKTGKGKRKQHWEK